jgi:hypothetical protein
MGNAPHRPPCWLGKCPLTVHFIHVRNVQLQHRNSPGDHPNRRQQQVSRKWVIQGDQYARLGLTSRYYTRIRGGTDLPIRTRTFFIYIYLSKQDKTRQASNNH